MSMRWNSVWSPVIASNSSVSYPVVGSCLKCVLVAEVHRHRLEPFERSRDLGVERERDAFVRLDAQHQHVRVGALDGRVAEERERRALELHGHFGVPARQPLAGTQIEGDAGPAPVVDVEPHRDERFGARVRRDVGFVAVALVLPAHDVARRSTSGVNGGTACSTFTFSSRTSSARNEIGGSIATSVSSWNMWFCTMSRSAPALS